MNKHRAYWLRMLGITAISFTILGQLVKADTIIYTRRQPTDVVLSDWAGIWDCFLDGRPAGLELRLVTNTRCEGNICQTIVAVVGVMHDGEGEIALEQKPLGYGDPPTIREDHLLPVRFRDSNFWDQALLMMHTRDRGYISGYAVRAGSPHGLSCRRV